MTESEIEDNAASALDASSEMDDVDPKMLGRRFGIDALISLIIIGASIVFLATSQQYADIASGRSDPGAAFWVQIVLVVLLISSIVNLAKIIKKARSEEASMRSGFSISIEDVRNRLKNDERMRIYLISVVLIVIYLAIFEPLGFIVSTAFFLTGFIWTLGYRKKIKLLAFTILISLFVFILFRNFMNVALPFGTGPIRELGIFIDNAF